MLSWSFSAQTHELSCASVEPQIRLLSFYYGTKGLQSIKFIPRRFSALLLQGVTLTDLQEAEKTIGRSRPTKTREEEKEEREKQDKEKQEEKKETETKEDDYRSKYRSYEEVRSTLTSSSSY